MNPRTLIRTLDVLVAPTQLRESGPELSPTLQVQLVWDAAVPFQVTLRIPFGEAEENLALEWVVDRELLAVGTASWAGEGAVRLHLWPPRPDLLLLALADLEDGRWGHYLVRAADLQAALADTYEHTPYAHPSFDVDHLVEAILREAT